MRLIDAISLSVVVGCLLVVATPSAGRRRRVAGKVRKDLWK